MAVSFAIASYQDVSERAVSDVVWLPALAGVAYAVYSVHVNDSALALEFLLLKIALIGGFGLLFTVFGGIGQADAIAIAFIAGDPYTLSPLVPLFATAAVATAHILYEYSIGNAKTKTVSMERFLKEQRWIPKAIVSEGTRTEVNSDVNVARDEVEAAGKPGAEVEVKYGVPTVAYLGVGYVAYLVYLLVFNYQAFASLP
jgi:Flp pilus assembly protein protease CpaA